MHFYLVKMANVSVSLSFLSEPSWVDSAKSLLCYICCLRMVSWESRQGSRDKQQAISFCTSHWALLLQLKWHVTSVLPCHSRVALKGEEFGWSWHFNPWAFSYFLCRLSIHKCYWWGTEWISPFVFFDSLCKSTVLKYHCINLCVFLWK